MLRTISICLTIASISTATKIAKSNQAKFKGKYQKVIREAIRLGLLELSKNKS